jgi:hypothetical protein
MEDGRAYYESVFDDLAKLNADEKIAMLYQLLGWFAREEEFQKVFSRLLNEKLSNK